jgi:ketosteroid isomerase-like protein
MSQDDVDIARRLLHAWSRRDVDAAIDLLHEDIEWRPALTAGSLEGTVYRGPDGVRAWFRELDDVWAELSYEIDEVRDVGEGRVVMLGHFHAVGRESGVTIDQAQGFVFTMVGGRVARALSLASQQDALEAAGLQE